MAVEAAVVGAVVEAAADADGCGTTEEVGVEAGGEMTGAG